MNEQERIESCLSENPQKTLVWIARKLNMPSSTLKTRIERYKKERKRGGVSARDATSTKRYKGVATVWNHYRGSAVMVCNEIYFGFTKGAMAA